VVHCYKGYKFIVLITFCLSLIVYPVADLEGVPWVPWNLLFEELPSFNSQCAQT